jgi:isoleucyl-tRNA synthetase
MGPDVKCSHCGGTAFRKENDILDVWFDSGASHLAVLTPENQLPWPSDMYGHQRMDARRRGTRAVQIERR